MATDKSSESAGGDDAANWVESLPMAVNAHNARPHSAMNGPPEAVEERPQQDFKVLQDNAKKGLLNRNNQLNKNTKH